MDFLITKKLNHLCFEVVTGIVLWHLTTSLSQFALLLFVA